MTETVSTEAGLVERLEEAHDRFAEFEGVNNDDLWVVLEAATLLRAAQEAQPVAVHELTQECRYCANTGWFYGDPDLKMFCGCAFGKVRDDATPVSPAPVSVGECALPPARLNTQALAAHPAASEAPAWQDMSCDEQFSLATQIAANIGYELKPEPDHPDSPHPRAKEALLPCPFCGGEAKIIEGEESAYVQCLDVKMHRALWFDGDNNAAYEVAEQWNRRAARPVTPNTGGRSGE